MSVTTVSVRHEAALAEFVADLATAGTWDEAALRYASLVAAYLGSAPDPDEVRFLTAATAAYRERRRGIAAVATAAHNERIIAARTGLRSHTGG